MATLQNQGLETQISYIKGYVNSKIAELESNPNVTVYSATNDGSGNNITETYLPLSEVDNTANGVPRFTSEGHLVLPSGIEIW